MGMTFSINPETDDLIEKVLILKGNKKLVNKLNQLKEKEYFVEYLDISIFLFLIISYYFFLFYS